MLNHSYFVCHNAHICARNDEEQLCIFLDRIPMYRRIVKDHHDKKQTTFNELKWHKNISYVTDERGGGGGGG